MERFGHKPYLRDCLKALEKFFHNVNQCAELGNQDPVSLAFMSVANRLYNSFGLQDERLSGVPAVCLRIPTGGGKTALGVRTIKTVRDSFLATPNPWVLWLVPSTTIRDQTLRQMRDRSSPLRQLMEEELGTNVLPLDMRSALEISRSDAQNNTVILVSTLATSRVEKTESRRFYRENGALMAHFENLDSTLLSALEKNEAGIITPSLCNLLRLHRPIVIVDEAHNNKSTLGFETLGRVAPCAIVELTATPDTTRAKANVLHYVMASQLKAAQMIKMPLVARQEVDWKKCLAEAKAQREELERLFLQEEAETGEFVRPVALIGAERKNEQHTVEKVIEVLTDELQIPRDYIAIATGEKDEVGEAKVGARECEIRYIITVDKLREGWDCPAAYILASVREMKSATAVEQLVGRILRMPNAKNKRNEHLNKSYAFLRSSGTLDAINTLKDALVNNGFTRPESESYVEQYSLPMNFGDKISVDNVQPILDFNARPKKVIDWTIPLLSLDFGGEAVALDSDFFLPTKWDINTYDALLTDADLGLSDDGKSFEFDFVGRDMSVRQTWFSINGLDKQLRLLSAQDDWRSSSDVALWLDKTVPHRDIPRAAMKVWLSKMCADLCARLPMREIEINRMKLRRVVVQKVNAIRLQEKQKTQQQLFTESKVNGWGDAILSEDVTWQLPDVYAPSEVYSQPHAFKKHAVEGVIGAMNGEELACAWELENAPSVKYWFRNIERFPGSFWLPTTSDKFYPDFVAQLNDGRNLVLEYKGAHLISGKDTEEKAAIGELWAKLSGGKSAFLLVGQKECKARILAV